MKHILLIIITFGISFAQAQETGIFSNFLQNDFFYNAAVAGSKDFSQLRVGYRNQWMGFSGAPINAYAAYYGSLNNLQKHGYGVSVVNENLGLTNKTGFYLNYAYHIKLSEKAHLGLGVRPGYVQYNVKLYNAQVADQGDNVLTGTVYSANAMDINTGFNFYTKNFFVMGAFNHLLTNNIRFTSYNQALAFNYNFMSGYTFAFPKKKFELTPAVLVRYVRPVPLQWSAQLRGTFNGKYWASLVYRSDDAAGVSVGMMIKERLGISYGYDFPLGGLRKQNSGSHELSISFIINKKKPTLEEEDEKLNQSIEDEIKRQEEERKQQEKNSQPTQP